MNPTLLEQFLREEYTLHVRSLLQVALEAGNSGTGPKRSRFEFNRFEIKMDLDEDMVLIEDVLDATDSGVQRVLMKDFCAAMEQQPV